MTHAKQRLQPCDTLMSDEYWLFLFDKSSPMLCVEGDTTRVVEATLQRWTVMFKGYRYGKERFPFKRVDDDARYLAKNLLYYSQQAEELLAHDPELTSPESVYQLRELVHRLAVGNTVAERLVRTN